jgi:hypothetical protein
MLPITFRQLAALIAVLALAASHWWAYSLGGKAVEADWAAERTEFAVMAAQDAEAARAKEQELTKKANDVQVKLNAEKKRATVAAESAANELRLLQEALAARSNSDSKPSSGADGASAGELLVHCSRVHSGMAAEADALANKLTAFQEYARAIKDACQSRASGK